MIPHVISQYLKKKKEGKELHKYYIIEKDVDDNDDNDGGTATSTYGYIIISNPAYFPSCF